MRRIATILLLISLLLTYAAAGKRPSKVAEKPAANPDLVPVTSTSPEAKKSFELGMVELENVRIPEAVGNFREAVKRDPNFALAHMFVAESSTDPAERTAARDKAKLLSPKASPSEQLMITWLAGAQEKNFVPAISAMNELFAKYPKDKRLMFLASRWFTGRYEFEQTLRYAQQALVIDPNYPAALNELGYAYADLGQLDKAFPVMEKYISLVPSQANPHDSYAEMLRKGGKYDEALEHYRMSLKIDPKFDYSQLGIGDVYMLKGDFAKARENYAIAAQMAPDEATRLQYLAQVPQTYVREKSFASADAEYEKLIARAHSMNLPVVESALLRGFAAYQTDDAKAFDGLERSEKALGEHPITAAERDEALAVVMRDRVIRAFTAGKPELAAKPLDTLRGLANTDSRATVQRAYHVAMGAQLLAEKKNGEAIEHLYEDSNNPVAMRMLSTAFDNMKAKSEADSIRTKLAGVHEPTIEQAVVTLAQ